MIIIGHPWVESQKFCKIFSIKELEKLSPNDMPLLEPLTDSKSIAQYCQQNDIPYAITVNSLTHALLANSLSATYMVCEEYVGLTVQPVAQEYLFDTRILVLIHDEKEISKVARSGIDGVIFPDAIC